MTINSIRKIIFPSILKDRRRVLYDVILLTIYIVILLTLLHNLDYSKMWAFGDLNAFPIDKSVIYEWINYCWRDEGLGFPNYPAHNYYLIILMLISVFGSLLAQKILVILTFIVAYFSLYYFLRTLKIAPMISFLGGLFYSINPITIAVFVGGGVGELMTYGVFPLIILYLFKLVREEKFQLKYIFIISIITIFIWNLYVTFWYGLFTCLGFLLVASRGNIKRLLRIIPVALMFLILFSPSFLNLTFYARGISEEKVSFTSTTKYNYADASILNLVRLAGNKGSAQAKEFLGYNDLNSYTVLGYFFSIIAFIGLIYGNTMKSSNRKEEQYWIYLIALLQYLGVLAFILILRKYPYMVDLNPIFSSLRNPIKLMYPLGFLFILILSHSLNFMLNGKKWYFKASILLCLTILILLYNYPALSDGTLGLEKIRGRQYIVEDKYYRLPEILKSIDRYYNEYHYLFLPWEYPLNLRIRTILPHYLGVPLGARILGINISTVKEIFSVSLIDCLNKDDVLSMFNVKYVIIDKTYRSYYENQTWYKRLLNGRQYVVYNYHNSYWISGNTTYFYTLFKNNEKFELVYEDHDFAIFKIRKQVPYKVYPVDPYQNLDASLSVAVTPVSENLVANPSFEEGLEYWRVWPGSLVNVSQGGVDGNYCAVLYGQEQWFTLIYQIVPVKEQSLYLIRFSFKAYNITDLHAKILWYNQTEKTGEEYAFKSYYIKIYEENVSEGLWNYIEEYMYSPKNARIARVEFLASRLRDQVTSTVTYIDNVSFNEAALIVKGILKKSPSITVLKFSRINPSLYEFEVNASEPFLMVFIEAYNPSWEIKVYRSEECLEVSKPTQILGCINAFVIKERGLLRILIYNKYQKVYEMSIIISELTYLTSILYVVFKLFVFKFKFFLSIMH